MASHSTLDWNQIDRWLLAVGELQESTLQGLSARENALQSF